ncbi:hypothetical protein QUA11_18750 [Microcoleus sp. S13_D1]
MPVSQSRTDILPVSQSRTDILPVSQSRTDILPVSQSRTKAEQASCLFLGMLDEVTQKRR